MSHLLTDERRVLDLARLGFPEVSVFGRYEYSSARPGLKTHTHPKAVEICYLERGCQTYRAAGREYDLVGGDLFVTEPGEPHDTGGHAEDRGILYWLNLSIPKFGGSILMLPAAESAALMAKLSNLPERHFAGKPIFKQLFNEIFALSEQTSNPFARVAVGNALVRCILEVIDCAYHQERLNRCPLIARIVERIKSDPGGNYTLPDLAEEAGLSLSRLKSKFKTQIGIAPHEFILRCKVEAAKKVLLDENRSVTDTAMELGFSSSQYFATVFKRFTQQTPLEYCTKGPTIRLLPATGPQTANLRQSMYDSVLRH